jgi:osmotically-inducible protein OsmY
MRDPRRYPNAPSPTDALRRMSFIDASSDQREAPESAQRTSAGFFSGYGSPDEGRSLQGGHGESDRHFGFDQPDRAARPARGPKGYKRSDVRIYEEVNERLAAQDKVDPSDIEVTVESGEVTLRGSVRDRREKFFVEQLVESISGVEDVHNQLRRTDTWT